MRSALSGGFLGLLAFTKRTQLGRRGSGPTEVISGAVTLREKEYVRYCNLDTSGRPAKPQVESVLQKHQSLNSVRTLFGEVCAPHESARTLHESVRTLRGSARTPSSGGTPDAEKDPEAEARTKKGPSADGPVRCDVLRPSCGRSCPT